MLKRGFDMVFSLLGSVILSPIFIVLIMAIKINSKGPSLYIQKRVGLNGNDFDLYKFRTMAVDSDKSGLLTVGGRDPRITSIGYYLRKFKLDELPQLINVLKGDMSFVGPRPEVRKYVDLYNEVQKQVLTVRPGITDVASIKYKNENEILQGHEDPEEYYIKRIMPDKIEMNLEYLKDRSFFKDIKVILQTFSAILT
ncbi:MAG: sugar transferase [Ignavibacteria bacterium]|nr:sugar transferase [Ignavibacteria bacterium]